LAPYDESVDLSIKLNVNPKKTDQLVRGTALMPAGLGKKVRVAVFTSDVYAQTALDAGADMAGEYLIDEVKKETINFDKALATPEIEPQLKPLGRILGPRRLMPSSKFQTLVDLSRLAEAIKNMKTGSVSFRMDVGGIVHVPIGRVSFDDEQLKTNMRSLIHTLFELRPATVKGKLLKEAYLTTSQGPAWRLEIESIDPKSLKSEL
jgi:large subunit ribosomal protein L1